jgi:hypothetical protein
MQGGEGSHNPTSCSAVVRRCGIALARVRRGLSGRVTWRQETEAFTADLKHFQGRLATRLNSEGAERLGLDTKWYPISALGAFCIHHLLFLVTKLDVGHEQFVAVQVSAYRDGIASRFRQRRLVAGQHIVAVANDEHVRGALAHPLLNARKPGLVLASVR